MSDEENKNESPFAHCKKCGAEKLRKPDGVFGNGKDRRYIDEEGKLWNGRSCGDCHSLKMKAHMKVKRSKDLQ